MSLYWMFITCYAQNTPTINEEAKYNPSVKLAKVDLHTSLNALSPCILRCSTPAFKHGVTIQAFMLFALLSDLFLKISQRFDLFILDDEIAETMISTYLPD